MDEPSAGQSRAQQLNPLLLFLFIIPLLYTLRIHSLESPCGSCRDPCHKSGAIVSVKQSPESKLEKE